MRRWRVYKDTEDRWLRWIAVPEHENWWEKSLGLRFPQWDMALNYANRMAHTAKPEPIVKTTEPDTLAKALSELGYKIKTAINPHAH
jgi:hypothetical protein